MLWLGVDVGGTFTDLVLYDVESNKLSIDKIPSSTHNQAEAVLAGMARMGIKTNRVARMVHGTTVATNTALELNGAKIAILVTSGHKDVLVVGRGNRMDLYNIKAPPKVPLLPRSLCFEVRERLRADGQVVTALDEAQVHAIADQLANSGVEAIAICFLHSYLNREHERRCAEIIAQRIPGAVVVTSAEVLPEYREYERFSTAAVNAYVAPRMRRYLRDLEDRLAQDGMPSKLEIMTSNGGSLPAGRIHDLPVLTMLSGPAAGVIAAGYVGKLANHPNLITCDIGGTSTDVCLVQDCEFGMTTDGHVGSLPIKIRQIDIHTVAVGGGSIADRSSSGVLTVGPRSAGSKPGPVCYGRGGTVPTITDANVVLGRLSVDRLLGNEIKLDLAAARHAIGRLADKVGLSIEQMAEGILRIATVSLASAIKEISIMRGHDPRQFALLPYGGAGPLQAVDIAAELDMDTVVIPPLPGTFSALGLLISDARRDYVKTAIVRADATDVDAIKALLDELVAQGEREFDAAGFDPKRRRFAATLDMRYVGQSFELSVPIAFDVSEVALIEKAFEEMYISRYGAVSNMPIEIVSYRVIAWSLSDKPAMPEVRAEGRSAHASFLRSRQIFFNGKQCEVPIYSRDLLPLDVAIEGPMLIEEEGSTTVVPPGWAASAESAGCLVIRRNQGK